MSDLNLILVKKAKKGDEHAFYQLVVQHKQQLYRIAYSYLKNEQDSLEAIQETTFRGFKAIKKLKKPEFFSSWLIRILINYCNDELRKRKRTIPSEKLLENAGYEEDTRRFELEQALETIDAQWKEVIVLKYFHDLKISDIAVILKCPEGTVKTWLNKGLKSLRSQLDGNGGMDHV